MRGLRPPSDVRLEPGARVLHDERGLGRFERLIPLTAAVNPHKARAVLRDGVLSVRLPRVPNRRGAPVTIPIETSSDATAGEGEQR